MPPASEEAKKLLATLQSIVNQQSIILQKEEYKLNSIIGNLRKQKTQNHETEFTTLRTQNTMYDLLRAWEENIQRKHTLHLDAQKESKKLGKTVQFIALKQAGVIRLQLDIINDLNIRLNSATADERIELNKEIKHSEWRRSLATENLEKVIEVMNKLKLDTTKFGAALVVATGDILNQNVKSEVVISVFTRLINSTVTWLQDNLPMIAFRIISFVAIIFFFNLIGNLVRKIVDTATASAKFNFSLLLREFLSSIAHKIIIVIGFMIALSQVGIEIAPLLAGMGIMGFVIGFALQDTLSNFASGLMILVYRPFDIGDLVDVAGVFGEVKQMNLVSTTILTLDNKRLIIPNSKIWGDIITNVSAEKVRRIDLVFGIGYGDSIEQAEKVLRDIVDSHELVLKKPETFIKVHTLNESSVDFVVRPWVKSANYWEVYWDITRKVKEQFDANGVSIPFPQRDLHIFQEK
ncbi:MAG: mechanosensitive ion channel [Methyloprofundus sp.]|nr:mechanosensitive ion channel [Methyloprofundus sp.]